MKIVQINIKNVLTPWKVVLLQKLVVSQQAKNKFRYFIAYLLSMLGHDNICHGLKEVTEAVDTATPLDTYTCTHVHAMAPIPVTVFFFCTMCTILGFLCH
jgi:hypothetical protein